MLRSLPARSVLEVLPNRHEAVPSGAETCGKRLLRGSRKPLWLSICSIPQPHSHKVKSIILQDLYHKGGVFSGTISLYHRGEHSGAPGGSTLLYPENQCPHTSCGLALDYCAAILIFFLYCCQCVALTLGRYSGNRIPSILFPIFVWLQRASCVDCAEVCGLE